MIVASVLILACFSSSGEVGLAFLDDPEVLHETVEVLNSSGVSEAATDCFEKMVLNYFREPLSLNTAMFPEKSGGFYHFKSVDELVSSLPHQLCDTEHPWGANCFDLLNALVVTQTEIPFRSGQIIEQILVANTDTSGNWTIVPVATAGDAFELLYPDWYRTLSSGYFAPEIQDRRICLTASLFRSYRLPLKSDAKSLGNDLLESLRASWGRQNIKFPEGVEVVLVHLVNGPARWFATVHAGLLVQSETGFTYIEKPGGAGPFLRLDLSSREDLTGWFSHMFKDAAKSGYTHRFVTFAAERIQPLDPY